MPCSAYFAKLLIKMKSERSKAWYHKQCNVCFLSKPFLFICYCLPRLTFFAYLLENVSLDWVLETIIILEILFRILLKSKSSSEVPSKKYSRAHKIKFTVLFSKLYLNHAHIFKNLLLIPLKLKLVDYSVYNIPCQKVSKCNIDYKSHWRSNVSKYSFEWISLPPFIFFLQFK